MVLYLLENEDVAIHLSELESLLEEALFLKGFQHRNVLGTVGIVWRTGDRPVIILPYMSRGSLKSLVQTPDAVCAKASYIHYLSPVNAYIVYDKNTPTQCNKASV